MTSQEYSYELKIPLARVAVLIGKKGEVKRSIESATKVKLDVDSKEGIVVLSGIDSLAVFTAREVIEAIGRGFNPEIAELLLKPDYVFEVVNVKDYAGKSKATSLRLKGRVIGKEGKSRKMIELFTDTHISIYGKTIGIIGDAEGVASARKAVESLLRGAPHGNVYKALEKRKSEIKRNELIS